MAGGFHFLFVVSYFHVAGLSPLVNSSSQQLILFLKKYSFKLQPSTDFCSFPLYSGVVKTYNLTFQECDPLQAIFAKHMCPNILKVHSR